MTLTGPGGVGKTRLAVAVAERLRIALEREVVFVELASLRDPALVLTAIAEAMGLQDLGSVPVKERLALTLRDRQLLLLLDNFEHLVSAARDIGALLLAGPQLQILVTGRLATAPQWRAYLPSPSSGAPGRPGRSNRGGYGFAGCPALPRTRPCQ